VRDIGLVTRSDIRLRPDTSRVVSRLFIPGQEVIGGSESRASNTVERMLALSEVDVELALEELFHRFSKRHEDLAGVFEMHAERIEDYITTPISTSRRQLLGAAFTHEYSLEGAAICNPSLVTHPDQSDVAPGALRVILSYRAIGEGHVSSICFRTGTIDEAGAISIDDAQPFPIMATLGPAMLNRDLFHSLLHDLGYDGETAASVLNNLSDRFSESDLEVAIMKLEKQSDTRLNVVATAGLLRLISACFYEATFDEPSDVSQRVLWPAAPNEGNGMEDARFVRFEGDGIANYVASYTAFDGHSVSQQLLETDDFLTFTSSPLAGRGSRNKGMAFFPRKVGGSYVAMSRHDRESNAIAFSTDLHRWDDVATAQMPSQPWEVLQLGNCGAPIELDEGWLVITHGVGPMRTYGIGALLLDLEDPTKVLGQLPKPLLLPDESEQDGYVPNVVYSCGSLVHNETLYLPYGIADQSIGCATVKISELLGAFEPVALVSP
jgi:predicted GH43/DUF377 family glycosyl hydrolase